MYQRILSFIVVLLLAATGSGQGGEDREAVSSGQSQAVARGLIRAGLAEAEAARLVGEMVEARFTAEQMTGVGRQMQATVANRAAQAAISGKVLEGIAKHAGAEAIAQAVVKVRERHELAVHLAEQVMPGQPAALGGIVADALTSGLTGQDAEKVVAALQARAAQPGKDRVAGLATETLTTARDIVRLGVSSPTTAALMQTALAKGFDEASMQTLRQSFNEQRMQPSMEQVAQRYLRAIEKGVAARDLARYGAASGEAGEKNTSQRGAGSAGASGGSGSSGGGGSGSGGGGGGRGGRGGR